MSYALGHLTLLRLLGPGRLFPGYLGCIQFTSSSRCLLGATETHRSRRLMVVMRPLSLTPFLFIASFQTHGLRILQNIQFLQQQTFLKSINTLTALCDPGKSLLYFSLLCWTQKTSTKEFSLIRNSFKRQYNKILTKVVQKYCNVVKFSLKYKSLGESLKSFYFDVRYQLYVKCILT